MKKANKKVNAAIIIIGNEILSGRTQDVNVEHLSKWLNNLGVKVEEVRVIADLENSIINTHIHNIIVCSMCPRRCQSYSCYSTFGVIH